MTLTILYLITFVGQVGSFSPRNYGYVPNGLETATGVVQATDLNSIEIYDEERKQAERFVYLVQGEEFHKGDYVRVYYHPKGGIVQMIKRMTVLEYKKNSQNLGYISHN